MSTAYARAHGRALAVTLREVTRHNIQAVMSLDAGDGGRQVAPNAKSMAQAAVYGEAWPRAIFAGDDQDWEAEGGELACPLGQVDHDPGVGEGMRDAGADHPGRCSLDVH